MSTRLTPFVVGEYYHIYNRGVDKRIIFLDEHDYRRFVALLYICNTTDSLDMRKFFDEGKAFVELFLINRLNTLVDIGVYTLMPNHFHILIKERNDGGISIFMQKLLTAYSMYFNKKYSRTGSLFEGKFRAKHINNEPYLYWVFSYIHLNIVKLVAPDWKENGISDINIKKVQNFVENYKYSSYFDYFTKSRTEGVILNKEEFPEDFVRMDDFKGLIQEFRENNLSNI